MSTILDTIAQHNRALVEAKKQRLPLEELRAKALSMDAHTGYPFRQALAAPGIRFICEVKRASPSKGLIAPKFPYLSIAREYEAAGAASISCLTEPKWFLGRDEYVTEISQAVSTPVLRKDFTIDAYMIYEAKVLGASAVLLICSLLDEQTLRTWRELAESLGMDALVEAHDEIEVEMALRSGARILGVNNRDLKTFRVDVKNSAKYRRMIPEGVLFVSESGISTREDIAILEENGTDAVLIGEALMCATDKKAALEKLRGIRP